jgi:O-antigen ligase
MPLGSIVGLIVLTRHPFTWDSGRYTTSQAFNLVHFSDTALMLGFLSLFSINWERKNHVTVLIFQLSGFMAGIYMSIQSGERGGWIAIPPLLLIFVLTHNRKKLWLKLTVTIPLVIATLWLSYTILEIVHGRINSIFSDINDYAHGNRDTSIGVRFQLYLAAIHLFIENPLFGVGADGFAQAMPTLTASGMITPAGGQLGVSEVHNEILAKCAATGLFGLLSILSIYIVPLFIFWSSAKSHLSAIRIASFMGICLVAGFFIFGLTVEIFDLRMTAAFFSFTLAVLMAAATHHDPIEVCTTSEINA